MGMHPPCPSFASAAPSYTPEQILSMHLRHEKARQQVRMVAFFTMVCEVAIGSGFDCKTGSGSRKINGQGFTFAVCFAMLSIAPHAWLFLYALEPLEKSSQKLPLHSPYFLEIQFATASMAWFSVLTLFLPMQAELLTDQEREWLALPPVPQGD